MFYIGAALRGCIPAVAPRLHVANVLRQVQEVYVITAR